MRRIPTQIKSIDRTFQIELNSQTSNVVNVPIQKVNNIFQMENSTSNQEFQSSLDSSASALETKTDINNQPVEDDFYDEVIYYDGGGVEGYGY